MWSADPTRRLPVELVSRTLDHLELQELIPILAVCKRRRQIAIAHRAYWRYVKVDSVSDSAIDFFLARLGCSGRRPISVEVNVEESSNRIGDEVLPTIALHLGHVEHLCLEIHEAQAQAVLDTLTWPAPILTGINASIRLLEKATGCPLLPTDLFLNDAPKLNDISLRNFCLPDVLPAVFSQAQDVLFGYGYNKADFNFIRSMFTAFPRMRRLALNCRSLVVSPKPLVDPRLTRNLELLDVMVPPCSRDDVLAQFPCDIIPIVIVSNPSSSTITNLLDMLPSGPLNLAHRTDVVYPEEVFHICVQSHSTGRERAFRQETSTFKSITEMPHDLLRRVDFSWRISSLAISHQLWPRLAQLLLPLPHLRVLGLMIETPPKNPDATRYRREHILPPLTRALLP